MTILRESTGEQEVGSAGGTALPVRVECIGPEGHKFPQMFSLKREFLQIKLKFLQMVSLSNEFLQIKL